MVKFVVISRLIIKGLETAMVCKCLTPKLNYHLTFFVLMMATFPIYAYTALNHFNTLFYPVLMYVVFVALCCVLFEDSLSKKLMFSFLMTIISVLVKISYVAFTLYTGTRAFFEEDKAGTVIMLSFICFLQFIFMEVWLNSADKMILRTKDFLFFCILPVSQLAICLLIYNTFSRGTLLFFSGNTDDTSTALSLALIVVMALLFLFTDVFVYSLLLTVSENTKLEERLRYLEARDAANMKYYHSLEKANIQTRKMRHDLANALEIARCMAESKNPDSREQARKILDSMEEELDSISIKRYSDNSLVNTIFTNCATECRKKGIETDFEVRVSPMVDMDKFDICRVMTNVLNNAVEATENAPGEKKIKVRLSVENHVLMLTGENSMGFHEPKNDSLEHGLGLKILSDIAEKYDGDFSYHHDDEKFYTQFIAQLG